MTFSLPQYYQKNKLIADVWQPAAGKTYIMAIRDVRSSRAAAAR